MSDTGFRVYIPDRLMARDTGRGPEIGDRGTVFQLSSAVRWRLNTAKSFGLPALELDPPRPSTLRNECPIQ